MVFYYSLAVSLLNGLCAFQCLNQNVFEPRVSSGDEDQSLDQ